jgi:hypothetical protein
VRCLAEYTHPEIQPSSRPPQSPRLPDEEEDQEIRATYNILLEYGEFDLDEFFAEILPPVLQTELEAFWIELFEVADAVEGIHNLAVPTAGVVRHYYGYVPHPHTLCLKTPLTHDTRWHADIKPDNILSVQDKFKLADPGFARFVKRTDKEQNVVLRGGTEIYGNHRCS